MVVNMNMRGSNEGSINEHLADTIGSVFEEVYTVDVKGSTNRELLHPTIRRCWRICQRIVKRSWRKIWRR